MFTRRLSGFLFGVTPLDPATFIGVAVLVGAVGTIAAFIPAYRASRIDPVVALRASHRL
jgi:ABC-type antimicrobial peptide transport system permease subunit